MDRFLLDVRSSESAPVEAFAEKLPPPADPERLRRWVERGEAVVPELARVLEASDDAGERRDALHALIRLGPRGAPAASAVANLMGKPGSMGGTVVSASEALALFADEELAVKAAAAAGAEAVAPLLRVLGERPWPAHAVRRALARLGHVAVPKMLDGLGSRPPAFRAAIVDILGDIRPARPEVVAALEVVAAADPEFQTRVEALDSLRRLGPAARPALPTLVRLLDSRRLSMAVAAAEALAAVGGEGPRAAAVLIPEVRSMGGEWGKQAAVEGLGLAAKESREAFDALVEALRASPYDKVRMASARALGTLGPLARDAVIPLILATDDEGHDSDSHRTVREESRDALVRIGPPGPEAVPALTALLGHRQSWTRLSAAEALGRVGPPARAAVPALAAGILEEEGWGGSWAEAIGLIGEAGPEVVSALEEGTREREPTRWNVPLESALALAALGKGREASLAYFRRQFDSRQSSDDFRIHAAEGLRRWGEEEPRVLRFLADVVRRTAAAGQEPWVAQRATDVLARYGAKAAHAVPAVVQWLERGSDWYRSSGLAALRAIGTPEAAAALARFGPPDEEAPPSRASLPGRLAPPSPAEVLIFSLRNAPSAQERARSARELGRLGAAGRPALFALVLAAGDEGVVAEASGEALERLGAPDPAAVSGLQDLLYNDQEGTVREAAKALGRLGPAASEAADTLAFRVTLGDGKAGCSAAEALVRIGATGPKAVDALKERIDPARTWNPRDLSLCAAHALLGLGVEREAARAHFTSLLAYDALQTRLDGAEGLVRLGEFEGAAASALAEAFDYGEPAAAARAAAILGTVGAKGDALLPAFERRLRRPDAPEGPVVDQSLRAVGTPRALGLLRRRSP